MSSLAAAVGFCDQEDSFEAGKLAAAAAFTDIGKKDCSLILAFCTGRHDYQRCFDGIRSEAGDTPIIGGPAIGVITNEHLGYEGYQVGVAALFGDLAGNNSKDTLGLLLDFQMSRIVMSVPPRCGFERQPAGPQSV